MKQSERDGISTKEVTYDGEVIFFSLPKGIELKLKVFTVFYAEASIQSSGVVVFKRIDHEYKKETKNWQLSVFNSQ